MEAQTKSSSLSPWFYVPSLYFVQAIPYTIVNVVSTILYKRLGVDNAQITLWTSFLYLPWVIKMFWGPFVDTFSTKRRWLLTTQFVMSGCLALVALSLQLPNFFFISLAAFAVGAFISATYDIATDGFYMLALNPGQQAFFVGIRTFFYRLAMLFCTGFIVILAGRLEKTTGNNPLSWSIAIGVAAVIFAILFAFHALILPAPESNSHNNLDNKTVQNVSWVDIFRSYFQQHKVYITLLFILFYRFGEAMLLKLASVFLLDETGAGGLGLATEDVGYVYGTFGLVSLICGGILGGILISKFGLKKSLFPMALSLNLPNLFYVYMAVAKPPIQFVYPLVSIEQFGYGIGTTAFMVYLMYICKGEYKTSHYAISTGLMALGMMIPGAISGTIQESVGYPLFFGIVFLATIPGMLTIFFLPLNGEEGKQQKTI
ncbi:MAG: MFS transporter [Mastigocoleus sp. MO_167.B18]|nr:MFS transporter [Mastigocoleus sp. MO_167.B18]